MPATRMVVIVFSLAGCAVTPSKPLANACPASIDVQIDTETAVSSWGGSRSIAMAGLNQAAAECVPMRASDTKKSGSVTAYRVPVTVRVRSAVVDTARYNTAELRGGLSSYIRLEAVSKKGVVLETDSAMYRFVETTGGVPVSGAIVMSPEEMARLAAVRASWAFNR